MLDMKFLRMNPEIVKENIRKKFQEEKLELVDQVIELDEECRAAKTRCDYLRSQRNTISKQIGKLMAQGKREEAEETKSQVTAMAQELQELEEKTTRLNEEIRRRMLVIPNIIDPSVPIGKDDSENVELERFGEPLHRFPAFTASVCNLRPLSRGRIDIGAADMHSAPLIDPNYLSDPEDLRVAADAIRITRRIVQAPALAAFAPQEYLPGSALQSEEDLFEAAGKIGTTIFHPVGTCRMGSGPLDVVDNQLRVHGIPGLRVADASIMPQITSGNTCSPTLMIAEKAAQLILKGAATQTYLNEDAIPTP